MTTEENEDRLPAIVDYLRMNPTPPAAGGGQHIHIHHHYAAPPPPEPPPKPTVAEQVIPWMWLALGAMIIGTVCAMILAVVMTALLIGLIGVGIAAAALAYLIKTTRESQINTELARPVRSDRRNR